MLLFWRDDYFIWCSRTGVIRLSLFMIIFRTYVPVNTFSNNRSFLFNNTLL
nr:MAG TPA: hypothetical protein [Bacteriophage sp.]